ncbi:OmpP1/FadL family transporter [Mesorhizobium sp. 10J20-29]
MHSLRTVALLAGSLAAIGSANAGGFSRGTADTDLIFEEGNFNMRAGLTIVMPQRRYETLTPPTLLQGGLGSDPVGATDGKYSQTYAIPSAAVKFNLSDDLRCAGTYTQPFGADSEYGPQAIMFGAAADGTGTVREGFTTDEFGVTCGYKFDLAKGRAWLIGGGFLENFDYSQTVQFAPWVPYLTDSRATLQFDGDYEPGYRIGAAYEIPEIALRAQILYRSEVNHTPNGTFSTTLDGVDLDGGGPLPPFSQGTAVGNGTLPQSVELKLQSGIAPGWLAFGTIKWTDWSALDTLDYTVSGGPLPGVRELEYYYRDGWTVTGGVGHAFTENISGVVGLTWDRGVSTTEDALSDTYTLAAGVALKDKLGGEVRFGGAVSYLTAASVSAQTSEFVGVYDPGASFAYSVGADWAYALSAGYKISW